MKKKAKYQRTAFPKGLAQPALRALSRAGIEYLEQLSVITQEQLSALHGIGTNAIEKIHDALTSSGLHFAAEVASSTEIDEYISHLPIDTQQVLKNVRSAIRQVAPLAVEVISYQMPAFKQAGIIVYFAAWQNHIGMYPPITGDEKLVKDVSPYAGPKGNLQFPLSKPMPIKLIQRIVAHRLNQNLTKANSKRLRK